LLKIGEIRELIRLLDETSVAELRIETDDMKLHLKKQESVAAQVAPAYTPIISASSSAPAQQVAPPQTATTAPVAVANVVDEDASLHTIKSPMVGTFYRSPSPEAAVYVERGHKVDAQTIVCIVEAMKLMNEIESEVSGEVVEVLAENGQLVEYGQPLFKIRLS